MVNFTVLDDTQRIDLPATLFGHQFGMRIEPAIYDFASMLSNEYRGGYWDMLYLANGGFFMCPRSDVAAGANMHEFCRFEIAQGFSAVARRLRASLA